VTRPFFETHFPSEYSRVPDVLDRCIAALTRHGWLDRADEPKTRLCLEEALVNAICHGNADEEDRQVGIELHEAGDTCIIKVRDEGEGFKPENLTMPECESLRGRGVCLIRHFMDRVSFNREENCLEMAFRKCGGPEEGGDHAESERNVSGF